MVEVLRKDPRALEIFLDELAMVDESQPKHMRFLANLPRQAVATTQQGFLSPK